MTVRPVRSFKSRRDLHGTLFEHYQSAVPPAMTPSDRVNVNISFSLYRVLHLVREDEAPCRSHGDIFLASLAM